MKYEVWAEGFLDQGMEGIPEKAEFIGFLVKVKHLQKLLVIVLKRDGEKKNGRDIFILIKMEILVLGLDSLTMKLMLENHLDKKGNNYDNNKSIYRFRT